jgi:hypothetical protein
MLKKYAILFCLLIAYTIVLAHSIIPHHHHHEDHETEQTSTHHHDDDKDDHDDSGLAHDFANFLHAGSTTDFHQQQDIKISCNTFVSVYLIALFDFTIEAVESPPPIVRRFTEHNLFLEYTLSSKGLRAPPCAIA